MQIKSTPQKNVVMNAAVLRQQNQLLEKELKLLLARQAEEHSRMEKLERDLHMAIQFVKLPDNLSSLAAASTTDGPPLSPEEEKQRLAAISSIASLAGQTGVSGPMDEGRIRDMFAQIHEEKARQKEAASKAVYLSTLTQRNNEIIEDIEKNKLEDMLKDRQAEIAKLTKVIEEQKDVYMWRYIHLTHTYQTLVSQ